MCFFFAPGSRYHGQVKPNKGMTMDFLTDLDIAYRTPVSGGCINNSQKIITRRGDSYFLKEHPKPPKDFFKAEKQGLKAIEKTGLIKVPKVLSQGEKYLLLEWVDTANMSDSGWRVLGESLAQMHQLEVSEFGFEDDGYCGETRQINPNTRNGFEFFRRARLEFQAKMAFDKGLINLKLLNQIESVGKNLERWIPDQAPGLLHGDLWSGNVIADHNGMPVLIDPAAHWGWPEAELAFSQMFGGFNDLFYQSYQKEMKLEPGFNDRTDLYNLYHYLNHLNLFGSSYLRAVKRIVERFGS